MTGSLSPVYPSGFSTRTPKADAEVIEAMRDPHYRIGWLERTLKEALRSLQAINDSRADLEAAYRIRDVEHTLRLSNAASLHDPTGKPPASVTRETWRWTFTNEDAAESYLAERGFSVGRRQGGSERGILLGCFDIQKWRNLSSVDRAALHGVLQRSGFDRDTPAVVTIFAAAPVEAHEAIRRFASGTVLPVAAATRTEPGLTLGDAVREARGGGAPIERKGVRLMADIRPDVQRVVDERRKGDARPCTWIGDDHPPGWRRVTSIDVADPANTRWARENYYRIGTIYDGGSNSVVEPCFADVYEEVAP